MRLSAAIRIGSMTTKQITRVFTDGGNGRCALGAACDAAGLDPTYTELEARFPVCVVRVVDPVDRQYTVTLFEAVYRMNDKLGMSREAIADWVETIEAQQEAAQASTEKVAQEVAL